MIKKWMKKAGAGILACMMMLTFMPVTNVHAAGEVNYSTIKNGDVIEAGTTLVNDSSSQIVVTDGTTAYYNAVSVGAKYVFPTTLGGKDIESYTVALNMMNRLEVSVNEKSTASATVADVTINGKVGEAQANAYDIKITISGDNIKEFISFDADVLKNMVTNKPAGLKVGGENHVQENATMIVLTVSRDETPIEASKKPLQITIPGSILKGGKDIVVTANPNAKWNIKGDEYDVTVNGGTSDNAKYEEGDTVTITANAPADGKQFKDWTVNSGGVTLASATSASTTFTMPASAVEVTANYEDIPVPASATITDMNVTGKMNQKIVRQEFVIELTNDEWTKGDINTPIITNLPSGLNVGVNRMVSDKKLECNIFGTPTASGTGTITMTIPGEWLKSGKDLTVTSNPNAKFEITSDEKPVNPVITVGAGSSHQIGAGKDMTFTCSGALEDLTGIYVDDKLVDSSNYTLKSGSTILTLKASYLDTLYAGKHTLKFQYKDNVSATTEFTVVAKGTTTPTDNKKPDTPNKPTTPDTPVKNTSAPKTGDTTNMMLLFSLLVLSGGAIGFVSYKKKRRYN